MVDSRHQNRLEVNDARSKYRGALDLEFFYTNIAFPVPKLTKPKKRGISWISIRLLQTIWTNIKPLMRH